MAFSIDSIAFENGGTIPQQHTCEGEDSSPPLAWSGAPEGTKSFALILDDPDAPAGTWNHWLLWDIPPAAASLPGKAKPSEQGVSGTNDFGRPGYGGPCPPRGHGAHRYFFRLHALDVAKLNLPRGARRGELDGMLKGHVLATAEYMGRYERK
ncbi:MAG: YbhB/YbcL family Raf kinase inhibitor-like protein [Acidobacteria bacterium]|nr:YbhB/YbcL family Raf kinase inhibitor-like protein [Acidobacteriota bacterium]MBI3281659.1 YbhB/YbcL family Raf kinase inhibitor-like protein [Acidobacteriota bacterium]